MRQYLLDTAPLAALLFGRPGATALITPWMTRSEVATSILAYGEVVEYLRGFPDFSLRRADLRSLLRSVHPYFLTYAIMERYADLRRQLRPPPGPGLIGDIDSLIAPTASEQNLTLVTADSDFQRVPGLKIMRLARSDLR